MGGGETFSFATFNIPGAPDATLMPVTQPGQLTECGATRLTNGFSVNVRLTIHGTQNTGPGITGLPRYVNASRMTLQPAANVPTDTQWDTAYNLPADLVHLIYARIDSRDPHGQSARRDVHGDER